MSSWVSLVVHGGAVAGFSLPTLKYYVSNGSAPRVATTTSELLQLAPDDRVVFTPANPIKFTWSQIDNAATYHLELQDLQGNPLLSAVLIAGTVSYRAPSWLKDKSGDTIARWRVIAFNEQGTQIAATGWRSFRFEDARIP